ncbi:sarcosine oxidase subunit gamma [Leisingera sp. ANG-M7]|uniref:sarcosine oxidase subunit gamma n=1 Tax=Leisingera sp. ANG-M7 TaxID=1577902 RepID=UPI00057F3944|nr:sarcosine oxidase subunit gamma [Leisingera sp. ANG-M7]KIC36603.1 sarcosine oxidase subunit gamma [Leisingera sp. ANG-M7]
MAELKAKSPCDRLLPITLGGMSLTEEQPGSMWVLAPFKGQEKALSKALEAAHGIAFPAANRATGKAGSRAVWFGREMALLMGPEPDAKLVKHAALTEQSDAWAVVRLDGAGAGDVLARLVPVDLRPQIFKRGHTVRTELKHMMASVTRIGPQAFQIMVFRSMAKTLVHDLKTAMEAVTARG